jgi:alkyldihydroxyacetonephosphate synthase
LRDYSRDNLRWNGWGAVDEEYDFGGRERDAWRFIADALEMEALPATPALELEEVPLEATTLSDDELDQLAALLDDERVCADRYQRLFHAVGKSYYDLIRLRRGAIEGAPDAVVYPRDADEIAAVLAFAAERELAVVPYGGGSSVVGGVEARPGPEHRGVLTLDTTEMRELLDLDRRSRQATFQAGIYGPQLEHELGLHGMTLGHYPQSFEYSTLGGWIAARGSGQQSNRYGTADEFLAAATVVTPRGILRTRDYPHSAAGPDLNHLIAGSEGTLGVISDATVRLHELPEMRDYRGYLFRDFDSGSEAIRQIVQAEIPTAMIRLSDADETRFYGAMATVGKPESTKSKLTDQLLGATGYGEGRCLMLLGLEGDAEQVRYSQARTLAACVRHGGIPIGSSAGESWFESRFRSPYLRDPLLDRGVGVDTLETSTTWANARSLHRRIREALRDAIAARGAHGIVMGHISHTYVTGTSLYFTFVFPRDLDDEIGQWFEIKRAASDVISAHGGTISHHHGVGADHVDWIEAEKGELGIEVLRAARSGVDPDATMNPGKLLP